MMLDCFPNIYFGNEKHCKFTEAFPITSFSLKTIYIEKLRVQKSSKMKK